jgi:hypothetical protein
MQFFGSLVLISDSVPILNELLIQRQSWHSNLHQGLQNLNTEDSSILNESRKSGYIDKSDTGYRELLDVIAHNSDNAMADDVIAIINKFVIGVGSLEIWDILILRKSTREALKIQTYTEFLIWVNNYIRYRAHQTGFGFLCAGFFIQFFHILCFVHKAWPHTGPGPKGTH